MISHISRGASTTCQMSMCGAECVCLHLCNSIAATASLGLAQPPVLPSPATLGTPPDLVRMCIARRSRVSGRVVVVETHGPSMARSGRTCGRWMILLSGARLREPRREDREGSWSNSKAAVLNVGCAGVQGLGWAWPVVGIACWTRLMTLDQGLACCRRPPSLLPQVHRLGCHLPCHRAWAGTSRAI